MCCTRNWYFYMATNLYALFKNNKVKKLYLFIEDDEIPFLKDKRIEFINVNKLPEYITEQSPNYNTRYTKMSYVRCYFTKVLNCDKIIYVDADAIVIDNIEELWKLKVETIAGVKEGGEWSKHLGIEGMDDKYINSGVLVMNLANIRKNHLDDEMINLLNTRYYHFPDQDVINIVFKDKMYLSNIYNSTDTTGIVDNAKIIHYIRQAKGWIKESPRSEIWFNYEKEMLGGNKMENYYVRATKTFNDYNGKDINNPNNPFEVREAGKSEWWCTGERYNFLKDNDAVELIEIKKVELPKVNIVSQSPVEEIKKPTYSYTTTATTITDTPITIGLDTKTTYKPLKKSTKKTSKK